MEKSNFTEQFQNVETLRGLLDTAAVCYGDCVAAQYKDENEELQRHTYNDFKRDVLSCAAYLRAQGFSNAHIGITALLTYQWLVAMFGITCSGNVAIPIDRDLGEDELLGRVENADITALFIDGDADAKIMGLPLRGAAINAVFCLTEKETGAPSSYIGFDKLLGFNADGFNFVPDKNDVAIMIFTSGTTGTSKIVMLTHDNVCADALASVYFTSNSFVIGDRTIPILPPHHMFEITTGLLTPFCYGATICFGGSLKYISKNIEFYKPSVLLIVPMIADNLYRKIMLEVKRQGRERVFKRAVKLSNLLRKIGIDLRRQIFTEIHKMLGGHLKLVVCGGAFLETELIKKYDDIGIPLMNGYGITECSPVISCNLQQHKRAGSVGAAAPKELEEVSIIDDEICVRGRIVMKGYYRNETATKDAFAKGWYHTGDLGHIDRDGFIFITGRLKNLIILSDGNNISPEELEIPLEHYQLIKTVFVCVKERKSEQYITACVYPDPDYVTEHNITNVKKEVQDIVDVLNASMPPYKRIKSIEISDKDFEKTALGKVKKYLYV